MEYNKEDDKLSSLQKELFYYLLVSFFILIFFYSFSLCNQSSSYLQSIQQLHEKYQILKQDYRPAQQTEQQVKPAQQGIQIVEKQHQQKLQKNNGEEENDKNKQALANSTELRTVPAENTKLLLSPNKQIPEKQLQKSNGFSCSLSISDEKSIQLVYKTHEKKPFKNSLIFQNRSQLKHSNSNKSTEKDSDDFQKMFKDYLDEPQAKIIEKSVVKQQFNSRLSMNYVNNQLAALGLFDLSNQKGSFMIPNDQSTFQFGLKKSVATGGGVGLSRFDTKSSKIQSHLGQNVVSHNTSNQAMEDSQEVREKRKSIKDTIGKLKAKINRGDSKEKNELNSISSNDSEEDSKNNDSISESGNESDEDSQCIERQTLRSYLPGDSPTLHTPDNLLNQAQKKYNSTLNLQQNSPKKLASSPGKTTIPSKYSQKNIASIAI